MPRPVMVVEDEPDLLAGMQTLLQDEGYVVYGARNGEEALAQLAVPARAPPGLIALDLTMPVMDGGTFLARFAATEGAKAPNGPKVVLVTAAESLPEKVVAAHAPCVMRKPIHIDAFLDLVAEHCGRP